MVFITRPSLTFVPNFSRKAMGIDKTKNAEDYYISDIKGT